MLYNKRKVIILVVIVLSCFIAGCATQGQVKADASADTIPPRLTLLSSQKDIHGNDFSIWHDDVNNVTCYVYHGAYGNTMTSIPDWQMIAPKYNNTMMV